MMAENDIDRSQPVILQVPLEEELSRTLGEIERLGGRIEGLQIGEIGSAFVKVMDLPYFSRIKALERSAFTNQKLFLEHRPHVWIEAGFSHPLAEEITVPADTLFLLADKASVVTIKRSAFRTIRERTALPLFQGQAAAFDFRSGEAIVLSLRLAACPRWEAARFWIITKQELQRFIESAGQTLIDQLAVALWPTSDPPSVLVRPLNETHPPVLVWQAEEFCHSRRVPKVFVPMGYDLHSSARPDILQTALDGNRGMVTWISPREPEGFQVHAVSQSAFGPLRDCVDYESHPPKHWLAWSPRLSWEPEPFEIRDDPTQRTPKRKFKLPERAGKKKLRKERESEARSADRVSSPSFAKLQSKDRDPLSLDEHAARKRLAELERKLLASDLPLDAEAQRPDWREMADLHFLLHDAKEGTLCLAHAVWNGNDFGAGWLEAAWWQALPSRWRDDFQHRGKDSVTALLIVQWEKLRSLPRATQDELSHWVLGLVWISATCEASQLNQQLREMQEFLERWENDLPARVAWLAWHVLTQSASKDVLTLARARDRFLERLFQRGLREGRDCPRFLMSPSSADGKAIPPLSRQWAEYRPLLHQWSQAQGPTLKNPNHRTLAYLDLILAFGLARQGEATLAQQLLASASEILQRSKDPLHQWCLGAYRERIEQALRGEDLRRPLSEALLEKLEQFTRHDRFKLDRLRQASRILEPEHSQDSFLKYHAGFPDELARELESLKALSDPALLAAEFARIKTSSAGPDTQYRILLAGLELAPRMGLTASAELLAEAAKLIENSLAVSERIKLLEEALRLAGHFDLSDWIQRLLNDVREIGELVRPTEFETTISLESFLRTGILGLRRYGLRGEMVSLLDQLEASAWPLDHAKRLAMFCAIAGGWFCFDLASRAWPILDEVRDGLLSRKLSELQKTQVAKAYIHSLGLAPAGEAHARLRELFLRVQGIHDAFSTSSHFLLSQISIAETLVLSLDGEANPLGQSLRKRLDEEEFCLRQRIHRDVRNAMSGY